MKTTTFLLVTGVIIFASATLSQSSHAAVGSYIKPAERAVEFEGVRKQNFHLKCSNGSVQTLTKWDWGRKWCQGANSLEQCYKKQSKAVKTACKARQSL